jgi:uncharacterized protein YkwD
VRLLRRSHVALLLIVIGVAIAPRGATAATADAAQACPGGRAAATLCQVNAVRQAHGLSALLPDRRLARAALAHSRDMVRRRYFAHDSPTGTTLVERVARTGWLRRRPQWFLGENLAWGVGARSTPAAVVQAWMQSPPHRQILLRAAYRHVGIGAVSGTPSDPTAGATYTADFGS